MPAFEAVRQLFAVAGEPVEKHRRFRANQRPTRSFWRPRGEAILLMDLQFESPPPRRSPSESPSCQPTRSGMGHCRAERGGSKLLGRSTATAPSRSYQFVGRNVTGHLIFAPTHRGFGTTVVTKMVVMSLDGKTVLDYSSTGLIWRLACPLKNVLERLPI
jgi:hypothetical protein